MALLLFDGFTSVDQTPKPHWPIPGNLQTQPGRDGSPNGSGIVGTTNPLTLPTPAAVCIVGFACSIRGSAFLGQGSSWPMAWRIGATTQLVLWINASGMLELRRTSPTGALLATSSGHLPITIGIWNHYQAKVVLSDTAGSAEVRLNGQTVINYTGVTSSAAGAVTGIQPQVSSYGNTMWWDDLWVCDGVDATATEGRPNNGFLGDLKVAALRPSAPGAVSDWTPSTSVANWTTVDEVPPNTTDYVSATVPGKRDLYELGDLPATVGDVYGVTLMSYAQKSDAGSAAIKNIMRTADGTVVAGAAQPLATGWAGYCDTRKVKSGTTPYTAADVNAMQVGVELA